jgi:hypothetical protein
LFHPETKAAKEPGDETTQTDDTEPISPSTKKRRSIVEKLFHSESNVDKPENSDSAPVTNTDAIEITTSTPGVAINELPAVGAAVLKEPPSNKRKFGKRISKLFGKRSAPEIKSSLPAPATATPNVIPAPIKDIQLEGNSREAIAA